MNKQESLFYFFGCYNSIGHSVHCSNGVHVPDTSLPFELHARRLDGDAFRPTPEPWREQPLHKVRCDPLHIQKERWTVMSMWDRSLDTRPESKAIFFCKGAFAAEDMWNLAKQHFPEIVKRIQEYSEPEVSPLKKLASERVAVQKQLKAGIRQVEALLAKVGPFGVRLEVLVPEVGDLYYHEENNCLYLDNTRFSHEERSKPLVECREWEQLAAIEQLPALVTQAQRTLEAIRADQQKAFKKLSEAIELGETLR